MHSIQSYSFYLRMTQNVFNLRIFKFQVLELPSPLKKRVKALV